MQIKKLGIFFCCLLLLGWLSGDSLHFLPSISAAAEDDSIVVMLDPGHADGDGGGTYAGKHLECWYNMKIALACKEALEANGNFTVYLSHPDNDTPATLLERAQAADTVNASVIVSLHIDGSDAEDMNGAEIMTSILPEFSLDTLADTIMNQLTGKTKLAWRGIYQRADTGDGQHLYYWNREKQWDVPDDRTGDNRISDYYGIITWGAKYGIPTVIIEHGFLTNAHDAAIIEDEKQLTIMGQADAAAIIQYFTGHTHTWETARTTDYPTNCCFSGKASYHCTVCHARRGTISLSAPTQDDHFYIVSEHKEKTCTEDGYTTYLCRIADNLNDKGYPVKAHTYTVHEPATGHSYTITEDRAVSHTKDGIHTEVCTICGDTSSSTKVAEGHYWEIILQTDATCTEDGICRSRCTDCGEISDAVTPATGHIYTVTEDRAATCAEEGIHTETCSKCADVQTTVAPKTEHHMEERIDPAPACETDGCRIVFCTVCGQETKTAVPKTGHTYGDGLLLKEPTFFHDGKMVYICQNDASHHFEESLPHTASNTQIILLCSGGTLLLIGCIAAVVLLILHHRKKKSYTSHQVSSN